MRTPEAYEKDDVRKYLKAIKAFFFSATTFGFGGSGIPDICCCIGGRFVSIEVKREGKIPTPIQNLRMDKIRRAGGVAIWGDSAEQIIEKLKESLGLPD